MNQVKNCELGLIKPLEYHMRLNIRNSVSCKTVRKLKCIMVIMMNFFTECSISATQVNSNRFVY